MSGVLNAFWGSAFASASAAMTAIATVTATGGETSLTFSSIPATYTDLQIRGVAGTSYAVSNYVAPMRISFNGDSGANYAQHALSGDGSTASVSGSPAQNFISTVQFSISAGINASMYGACIFDISDYASTSKNKTMKAFVGGDQNVASPGFVGLSSGLWVSTAAITSVNINAQSGSSFRAASTFTLYGIKAKS
jgi:hypothetical protein